MMKETIKTLKVNVYAWVKQPLPMGVKEGVQEITPERIVELFNLGCDVALMHTGAEGEESAPLLALDERFKKFRQR